MSMPITIKFVDFKRSIPKTKGIYFAQKEHEIFVYDGKKIEPVNFKTGYSNKIFLAQTIDKEMKKDKSIKQFDLDDKKTQQYLNIPPSIAKSSAASTPPKSVQASTKTKPEAEISTVDLRKKFNKLNDRMLLKSIDRVESKDSILSSHVSDEDFEKYLKTSSKNGRVVTIDKTIEPTKSRSKSPQSVAEYKDKLNEGRNSQVAVDIKNKPKPKY